MVFARFQRSNTKEAQRLLRLMKVHLADPLSAWTGLRQGKPLDVGEGQLLLLEEAAEMVRRGEGIGQNPISTCQTTHVVPMGSRCD